MYDLRRGNEFVYDDKILWLIGSLGLDLRNENDKSLTKKAQKASKYSIRTNQKDIK